MKTELLPVLLAVSSVALYPKQRVILITFPFCSAGNGTEQAWPCRANTVTCFLTLHGCGGTCLLTQTFSSLHALSKLLSRQGLTVTLADPLVS